MLNPTFIQFPLLQYTIVKLLKISSLQYVWGFLPNLNVGTSHNLENMQKTDPIFNVKQLSKI